MKRGSFEFEGHRVAWRSHGQGRPIVVLHGLTDRTSSFDPFLRRIGRHARALAFDFLGSGESDYPTLEYTPDLYRRQVVAFFERFDLQGAILVGLSRGVSVAAMAAAGCEQRLRGFVFVCGCLVDPGEVTAYARRDKTTFLPALRRWQTESGDHEPTIRRYARVCMRAMYGRGHAFNMSAVRQWRDAWVGRGAQATLSTISYPRTPQMFDAWRATPLPSMFVFARADPTIPTRAHAVHAEAFPRAKIHVLPGGHCLAETASRQVARLILQEFELAPIAGR